MKKTYTLTVTAQFAAAHRLRGYVGKCARVHGHNYKVQAQVRAHQLDQAGLAIDYYDVQSALFALTEVLDHQYINEIPPFDQRNPSAENMAQWFYQSLKERLRSMVPGSSKAASDAVPHVDLAAIILWETDDFSVHYTEDE